MLVGILFCFRLMGRVLSIIMGGRYAKIFPSFVNCRLHASQRFLLSYRRPIRVGGGFT